MISPIVLAEVTQRHGGKAAGLRLLLQKRLRVPEGVALDTDAVSMLLDGDPDATRQLSEWLGSVKGRLAVRSSALNEDGAERSFAGMYDTVLKVPPLLEPVLESIRKVSASGRSERANAYAGQTTAIIPVVLQNLVEAESSGVIFTKALDPSGQVCAYVEWVSGFGDSLVSGKVTPATITLPWHTNSPFVDREAVRIAQAIPQPSTVSALIELIEGLSEDAAHSGWDVEWAIDRDQQLWVLQLRPQTQEILVPERRTQGSPLPAAPGLAAGPVRIVEDDNHTELQDGEVLVAQITEVNYISAMKRCAAIVTEEGGLLSHAAIVAREFGKPCVVGVAGARTLLIAGERAEVDGSAGTVRQGGRTIGGGFVPELDWTYLYLYDRGFEFSIGGIPTYVEPTMDGIVVYIDDEAKAAEISRVDAEIRRRFRSAPKIVVRDKRIWYREWRRFNQLETITAMESKFKSALASWSRDRLETTIETFKNVSLSVGRQRSRTRTERLFWKELGAALHALVAVQVEGYALWNSYRESATWRANTGISFIDFVREATLGSAIYAETQVRGMRDCLVELARLRNDAYPFFSQHKLFDGDYFGAREELVRDACSEAGIEFDSEDVSLSELYRSKTFARLDDRFARSVFGSPVPANATKKKRRQSG